jgi:hypothetical protein
MSRILKTLTAQLKMQTAATLKLQVMRKALA